MRELAMADPLNRIESPARSLTRHHLRPDVGLGRANPADAGPGRAKGLTLTVGGCRSSRRPFAARGVVA